MIESEDTEGEEVVVKDVKNYQALNKMDTAYRMQTNMFLMSEQNVYQKDPVKCESIRDKANDHYNAMGSLNKWSKTWAQTIGKMADNSLQNR